MGISEKKMQIVINNYFKQECSVNTSIREAFEKGFRIGIKKASSAQPEPSADVVPVVRCKDCKHHAYDEIFSCYWCEYSGRVRDTTSNGFCEKGEE